MTPYINDQDFTLLCPCGCGERFAPIGSRGRPRSYYSPACSLRVNHNTQPSFAGRKHTPEARAKISASASRPRPHLRGERNGMYGRAGHLNPRYIDGSSPDRQRAYASAEWRELVRIVRARDGYRCATCHAEKRGHRSLHLHHVKPWAGNPESRFDPNNIVTLCATCHRAEHAKGGGANE